MSPEELETSCGLGQWRPKFLQALASKKVYIFIYGAIGIIKVRSKSHRMIVKTKTPGNAVLVHVLNSHNDRERVWHKI